MAYDLLVKNGRIVDGSGMPAFIGDVAIRRGTIVEMGKLSGTATRTINADGLVVAPGFIDNHCHYDAQVLWDPLCSFSSHHGATTVIFGNCSLGLAPVKASDRERLAGMLSYVEAIPMDVLQAGVPWNWTSFPEHAGGRTASGSQCWHVHWPFGRTLLCHGGSEPGGPAAGHGGSACRHASGDP